MQRVMSDNDWAQHPYPWSISYERYQIPPSISMPPSQTSLLDIFEHSFATFANQTAYIHDSQHLSYQQLDRDSLKVATYLQQLGLIKRDKVGIMLPNLLQYPVIALGILRAGLVLVNINLLYTSGELAHQLSDAGVKTLFILENFIPVYQQAFEQLVSQNSLEHCSKKPKIPDIIVCRAGDMRGHFRGGLANRLFQFSQRSFFNKSPVFASKSARVKPFSKTISTDIQQVKFSKILYPSKLSPQFLAGQAYQRPQMTLDDIALLQYTGGTTGVAKGAMLTHGNLLANVLQIDTLMKSAFDEESISDGNPYHQNFGTSDIILTALPLYHVFAFTIGFMYLIYRGFTGLLIANPRNLPPFIAQLQQYPPSFFVGVNTLFSSLLQQPNFQKLDFSQLKASIGGGMAISIGIAEQWHAVTGTPIVEGYGLSETAPVVAFNPLTIAKFTHKIGIPAPSTHIKLIDTQGNAVGIGERGEIVVKGPQVMKGYHNSLDDKGVFTDDGFFCTGDIGIMDAQGFIKVVDRKKDMILVSGFNVYPNEIESVINQHPNVIECGAIGVPSDIRGEDPKIFVVCNSPHLSEQALLDYGKQHLTGYKRPRHVEFVDHLPKSPMGKILRRELRKREGLA